MDTLKHLKEDVTEVKKGMECGIGIESFNDVREGDVLQFYDEVFKPVKF
jgi:translation initiation factor IF-2